MLRSLLLLLFLSLTPSIMAQTPATWAFGISLQPTTDGQLFSTFLVRLKGNEVISNRPIGREAFVKQAQGRAPSDANPDKEDLFARFDIKACYLPPDSVAMGYSVRDCSMLDELWKLRFQAAPNHEQGRPNAEPGWAGKPMRPSDGQLAILAEFGLRHTSGMIVGEAVFRLLKAMSDPAWVARYSQA